MIRSPRAAQMFTCKQRFAAVGFFVVAALVANGPAIADNRPNWSITQEVDEATSTPICVLQSAAVDGFRIRYADGFSITGNVLLDDVPRKMGWQVDNLPFRAARRRDDTPYTLWMTNSYDSGSDTVRKLVGQFQRGREVEVKLIPIFEETKKITFSLKGFTAAHKDYQRCKKSLKQ